MNNSSMNDTAYKMYNFLGSERNGNGSYITAPPFVCVREILINIVLWDQKLMTFMEKSTMEVIDYHKIHCLVNNIRLLYEYRLIQIWRVNK